MSVAGIFTSVLGASSNPQTTSGAASSVASTFESYLQSGNLSGAQAMFPALQQKLSAQHFAASGSSISQEMAQLGQDLKSGSLTAAQNDFLAIKQTFAHGSSQSHSQQTGTASTGSHSPSNGLSSDQLTAAMQAYSSLQHNPVNSALGSTLKANSSTFALQA